MITTIKIIKGLGEVEDMLLRNITRTLVELEMHIRMNGEQILQYYDSNDPSKDVADVDRQKLIDDTLFNLKGDIFKLEFYQKYKEELIHAYGKNYNKVGDIVTIAQGRADEGMRKRSAGAIARKRASEKPRQSSQGDNGSVNDATKIDNAQRDIK